MNPEYEPETRGENKARVRELLLREGEELQGTEARLPRLSTSPRSFACGGRSRPTPPLVEAAYHEEVKRNRYH
jgi:hypothetical protein